MYSRLKSLLLANDVTLDPPTHIQYFPLSLQLARSLVKEHPYLTSAQMSNQCLLLDLKARGLTIDPEIAVGDGALGFWKALPQVWPATTSQRCWCHKTANVLNKLPKGEQPRAKDALHQIWMAGKRDDAQRAFDLFVKTYDAKFPKAVACLVKDRNELLAFYDFPAEHWKHLRTTNPIESTFATVRLRTKRTKGSGSREVWPRLAMADSVDGSRPSSAEIADQLRSLLSKQHRKLARILAKRP